MLDSDDRDLVSVRSWQLGHRDVGALRLIERIIALSADGGDIVGLAKPVKRNQRRSEELQEAALTLTMVGKQLA